MQTVGGQTEDAMKTLKINPEITEIIKELYVNNITYVILGNKISNIITTTKG
jgi:hypothetical protein